MSDSSPPNVSDQADKKKSNVNFDKLYDKLFAPPQQPKKEQHKSFRYIPKFSSKQQPLSELEEAVRLEAQSAFLSAKSKAFLNKAELQELWNALVAQVKLTPTSNGRINYDEYIEVRSKMSPKIQAYFSPSLFLKLEKDEFGRISILTFFQFCVRKAAFFKARITIHAFDTKGDGFLTEHNMDDYVTEMMKSFPYLDGLDESLVQYYACLSTRKFFFFLDPMKTGKISITNLLSSPILAELLTMEEPSLSEDELVSNWFSPLNFHRIYENYLELDRDGDGLLSFEELLNYAGGSYTHPFITRVFQEFHTFQGKLDFKNYLNFILMLRYKSTPESLKLYFQLFDFQHKGFITSYEVLYFVREMIHLLPQLGVDLEYSADDVRDEVFDLSRPAVPDQITLKDLVTCRAGEIIVGIMTNALRFYNYDQREFNASGSKERIEDVIPIPPQDEYNPPTFGARADDGGAPATDDYGMFGASDDAAEQKTDVPESDADSLHDMSALDRSSELLAEREEDEYAGSPAPDKPI